MVFNEPCKSSSLLILQVEIYNHLFWKKKTKKNINRFYIYDIIIYIFISLSKSKENYIFNYI